MTTKPGRAIQDVLPPRRDVIYRERFGGGG